MKRIPPVIDSLFGAIGRRKRLNKGVGNTLTGHNFNGRQAFIARTHRERQRKVLNRLFDAGPDGFEGEINTRKYMSLGKTSRTRRIVNSANL